MKKIIQIISLALFSLSLISCVSKSSNLISEDSLTKILNEYSKDLGIPFSAGLYQNSKSIVAFNKQKDSKSNFLFNKDMRYEIGSVSKVFLSVALHQLKEKGLIDFNDNISKYLDKDMVDKLVVDENGVSYGDKVKVYQLMNHTSGVVDFFDPEGKDDMDNAFKVLGELEKTNATLDQVIERSYNKYTGRSAYGIPGSVFKYSNTNYIILRKIFEKITNEDYKNYIKREIFDKASMNNTSFGSLNSNLKGNIPFNNGKKTKQMYYSVVSAAGEIISTPADMLKFASFLLKNKFFTKEETLRDFLTNNFAKTDDSTTFYGKGIKKLILGDDNAIYFHTGGTFGFTSGLFLDFKNDKALFLCSNQYNANIVPVFLDIFMNQKQDLK